MLKEPDFVSSDASQSGSIMPVTRRVAVVEDDAMLSLLLEEICHHAGHTVVGRAHSPAEGLALIREARPDCLLVDFQLNSEVDGIEVLRQAREMFPDIYSVLISGWNDNEIEERVSEVRPNGVLRKPLKTDDLVTLLAAR